MLLILQSPSCKVATQFKQARLQQPVHNQTTRSTTRCSLKRANQQHLPPKQYAKETPQLNSSAFLRCQQTLSNRLTKLSALIFKCTFTRQPQNACRSYRSSRYGSWMPAKIICSNMVVTKIK